MRRAGIMRKGFSLLETMLAVALSAILMGLIAAGLQLYAQVVADRNEAVTNAQLARAVLTQICSDLRAAIYEQSDDDSGSLDAGATDDTIAGDDGGTGTGLGDATSGVDNTEIFYATADLTTSSVSSVPGVYGNQTELRIDVRGNFPHPLRYDSIVEAGGDPVLENLISVDQVVTYYLRSASPSELDGTPLELAASGQSQELTILVRRVQKRAEAEHESALGGGSGLLAGEQLLSDHVVGLEFAYHDGFDWTDSWDSELDGGLPIAVQITVTIADSNDLDAVITTDNIFQAKVALPTAAMPSDTSSMEGF